MTGLKSLPLAVACMTFAAVVVACDDDTVRTVPNPGDGNSTPTMVTTNVDTYVSDSGYIKYHAVTDVWEVYDDTDTPFWRFPSPLSIDMFAPGMKPDSHVECDSAIYYSQRRLFRFDGNVMAVNINRDTFLTQQLYWDQQKTEFYTDSFIHIVKSDRIIEGYGFSSNEKMTKYSINRPTAIMPASSLKGDSDAKKQAAQADSIDNVPFEGIDPLDRPTPIPASQRQHEMDQPGQSRPRNSNNAGRPVMRHGNTTVTRPNR